MTVRRYRLSIENPSDVVYGRVRYSPLKSLWFIGNAIAGVVGAIAFFSWSGLAVFHFSSWLILIFGHSLGTHRLLVHRSYDCPKWLERILIYLGCIGGLGGPISLVKEHDLREDIAHQLPLCHDYLAWRGTMLQDGWRQIHCNLQLDTPPSYHLEPELAEDRFYRFLEKTWMLQQLPIAVLFYLAGGWSFVFFGTSLRVTVAILGRFLVNHLVHNVGSEHYRTDGAGTRCRNVRRLSLISMGESWHNNHHAYPWSAKHGLFPGEWDLGWIALLGMKRLGLVTRLGVPDDLPERPDVRPVSELGRNRTARTRYSLDDERFIALEYRALCRLIGLLDPRNVKIVWPASVVSASQVRRLAGAEVEIDVDPRSTLFILEAGGQFIRGLPAACLMLACKGPIGRALAHLLLPFGIVAEKIRDFFRAAQPMPV